LSRLFSLRLVVIALALLVAVAGGELSALAWLDRTLFDLLREATGRADTLAATQLTSDAFASALAGHDLALPAWGDPAVRATLLATTLFLVAGLPVMGTVMAAVVTLLIAIILLLVQAGLMLYQQTWLPLGQVTLFLLAGFLLMLFWLQPHREIRALRENARSARYQLGKLLLQQGQPDDALSALAPCPPDENTLELQYDIAIQQERKRQYDSAARTYRQILARHRRFRDVAERLRAMEQLTGDTPLSATGPLDATRTLVMPDQAVSKPTLGRYEIEREIGRGAMGVVYLGKDPRIARTVAIKTFSYQQFEGAELKDLKARFFREAEAAGRLNHPDIVTVYDVGEESDLAFIAMDFAEGKPLSAHAKAGRLLPLTLVLAIVARVADALDYAHRQKIVHRDIKPGNIIYHRKTNALKITDFGIAKIADDSRTRTGSVMGSPLYMSPEQLKGQKVSGASDIYSLGVTLYRLVSGETPYQGDTLANLTYQILNKRPRSVREINPDLPNGVVRLINKAIQRDPEKRFPDAGTMAEALRRLAQRVSSEETS